MSDAWYNLQQFFPGNSQPLQTPAAAPQQSVSHFGQAVAQLQLTPQEQNLYQHHLDNLWSGGRVEQPGGSVSSVLQAVTTGPDGRYYNIPTVWNGKALSVPQARKQVEATGGWQRWPSYDTPEAADTRYEAMHKWLEQDTAAYLQQHPELSVTQSRKGFNE